MKSSDLEVMKDMSEQDYQAWKRHPVSQILFEFLVDKSVDYRTGVLQRWEQNAITLTEENEFKFRIQTLRELCELTLSDIKAFYESKE